MPKNKLGPVIVTITAAGLLFGGCSAMHKMLPGGDPAMAEQESAEGAALEIIEAPAAEVIEEPQTLVYEWDTEFSSFLSPPIEVRRLAKEDCQAAGYEVAVVGTLMLEANIATVHYTCRGDFE